MYWLRMQTISYYSDQMSTTQVQIEAAFQAKNSLLTLSEKKIRKVLRDIAKTLRKKEKQLLAANQVDLDKQDPAHPKRDRLLLNSQRLEDIAAGIEAIAELPDPAGKVLEKRKLSNGLRLKKITVPLGVVAAIYESRPNVTFDIAALCLRSRNVALLKGSSEAEHTNKASVELIQAVLIHHNINPAAVTLLPAEREVVDSLLQDNRHIDVVIPRGSDGLIRYVREHSRIPVIETGAGVCHVYVEKDADLQKAVNIVVNAKTSRPSVCNSMDTLLVDRRIAGKFLQQLQEPLRQREVEIHADPVSYPLLKNYPLLREAVAEDFDTEFLSLTMAVKVVDGLEEALAHIATHSTRHSEAIVTENKKQAARFLQQVDAAAVYANASTRFTDGAVFGLGAEIGISTQKLHARGPFALEKLVTEKWIVQGKGQIR